MCRHFRLRCRQRHFNRLCRSGLPRVNRRVSRRLGDRWRREFKLALRVGDAMLRVDVMHLIDVMLFIGAMQLIRSAGGRAVGLWYFVLAIAPVAPATAPAAPPPPRFCVGVGIRPLVLRVDTLLPLVGLLLGNLCVELGRYFTRLFRRFWLTVHLVMPGSGRLIRGKTTVLVSVLFLGTFVRLALITGFVTTATASAPAPATAPLARLGRAIMR
jgi:hypothetical protein